MIRNNAHKRPDKEVETSRARFLHQHDVEYASMAKQKPKQWADWMLNPGLLPKAPPGRAAKTATSPPISTEVGDKAERLARDA